MTSSRRLILWLSGGYIIAQIPPPRHTSIQSHTAKDPTLSCIYFSLLQSTMASEDILPTYEEVMKTYQTPPHVLRFEARTITYAEESSVSKIKSFLARPDHSHTDDVQVKKTRKSKVAEVLVKVLTGMCNQHTVAIVSLTDLFDSSNPEALLDRLECFEESGSGKTVTLPSSFHQECFQYTIVIRT
jgi:hypothetical protein